MFMVLNQYHKKVQLRFYTNSRQYFNWQQYLIQIVNTNETISLLLNTVINNCVLKTGHVFLEQKAIFYYYQL